jgi:hypothetical protein
VVEGVAVDLVGDGPAHGQVAFYAHSRRAAI